MAAGRQFRGATSGRRLLWRGERGAAPNSWRLLIAWPGLDRFAAHPAQLLGAPAASGASGAGLRRAFSSGTQRDAPLAAAVMAADDQDPVWTKVSVSTLPVSSSARRHACAGPPGAAGAPWEFLLAARVTAAPMGQPPAHRCRSRSRRRRRRRSSPLLPCAHLPPPRRRALPPFPECLQVLTRSYLNGAALGLPVTRFRSMFTQQDSACTLCNEAGHEVEGRVKRKAIRNKQGEGALLSLCCACACDTSHAGQAAVVHVRS